MGPDHTSSSLALIWICRVAITTSKSNWDRCHYIEVHDSLTKPMETWKQDASPQNCVLTLYRFIQFSVTHTHTVHILLSGSYIVIILNFHHICHLLGPGSVKMFAATVSESKYFIQSLNPKTLTCFAWKLFSCAEYYIYTIYEHKMLSHMARNTNH